MQRQRFLRKSVAQLAVLALIAGGALFALTAPGSAGVEPSCDQPDSAHFSAHVLVCKSGPETANAGEDITYTISSSAWGWNYLNLLTINDEVPDGTTLVSAVPVDGDWDCSASADPDVLCTIEHHAWDDQPGDVQVTVHIDSSVPAGSAIKNCADLTWTFDQDLLESGDVQSQSFTPPSDESCVDTEITQSSDLAIVKTAPAEAFAGHTVTYTVSVTNNGPSDSGPIEVTDPIPSLPAGVLYVSATTDTGWTCTPGSTITCDHDGLAAGDTSTFQITFQLPAGSAGSTLTNCATVSGGVQQEQDVRSSDVPEGLDPTNDTSCAALPGDGLIQVDPDAVVKIQPNFPG
jgi:uncharacterized repeat protein (TIGR01451 family)